MQQTAFAGLPYPESSDPATVQRYFQDLAESTDPWLGPAGCVYAENPDPGDIVFTDLFWGLESMAPLAGTMGLPVTGVWELSVSILNDPTENLEWVQLRVDGAVMRPGFTLPTTVDRLRSATFQKTIRVDSVPAEIGVYRSGDTSILGASLAGRRIAP